MIYRSPRLNPGTVDYMANLSPDCRRYLRGAARDRDRSKEYQGFLLSQAHEDAKTAKDKRAAADRRKKRVDDRMVKLNAFEPILNLKRLMKMTVDGDRADRIKGQLSWHKSIGGDVNIPHGFHAFRKAKAWVAMVNAVRRHLRGVAHRKLKGKYTRICKHLNLSAFHRTRGDRRRYGPIQGRRDCIRHRR
jgi:hypothetical protein